jgi:hypothetical protein
MPFSFCCSTLEIVDGRIGAAVPASIAWRRIASVMLCYLSAGERRLPHLKGARKNRFALKFAAWSVGRVRVDNKARQK